MQAFDKIKLYLCFFEISTQIFQQKKILLQLQKVS